MKYYKIITEDNFIGAISSDNFIFFDTKTNSFMRTNEQYGELVEYMGRFYRDTWMRPIGGEIDYDYTTVIILSISYEEYNNLKIAIKNHENIPPFEEDEVEELSDPIAQIEIEYVRNGKLKEMSTACRTTIEAGFDLDIRGDTRHFSLTTQDLLNLMALLTQVEMQDIIPYHADGEETTFYTAAEIKEIIVAATSFKNYQLAYYNSLKTYINALETIEQISAITYGTPIPEEYKSDVLKVLEEV